MNIGISNIGIYVPPFYLSHDDLAEARGVPKEKFKLGLGNNNMAIVPLWEDIVTLGANAAEMVLHDAQIDKDEIGLLIVSTETGVDQSKPVSSFVQGLLGIGPKTRLYEVKHACYGGTAAIMIALDWIKSRHNGGRKALVITTDIARYGFNSPGEPTQGAGSVAFVISDQAELIQFTPSMNACFSKDVYDFWKPNGGYVPIVDGKYSIQCYLEALEFCAHDLQNKLLKNKRTPLQDYFDFFVYHLPFTKMAHKAHYRLLSSLNPHTSKEELDRLFELSFEEKVNPTLEGAKEVGNIYTGSAYMGLISLMEQQGADLEGSRIGIFSYGSGCGAEYFPVEVGTGIREQVQKLNFRSQLERRTKIGVEEYTDLYSQTNDGPLLSPENVPARSNGYTRHFFRGTKDFKRVYFQQ